MPSGDSVGARAAVHGVRAGGRFRQRVGADNFSGREPRQILLLLLFGAEVNDGQRADAGVSAPGGGEAGVLGDVVGDDGGRDFVHLQAAVGLGDFHRAQAQFAGLLQQIASDGKILVLDLLDVGNDLVDRELLRRLPDELVLLGEVFRSEDFVGPSGLEQEAAARNLGLRNCRGCHVFPLRKETAAPRRPAGTLAQF